MPPTPDQVCQLGDEACELLTGVINRCGNWRCVTEALASIPLDVSQQQSELDAQMHLATRLKAILFPHKP
jgi:hypothetical protein